MPRRSSADQAARLASTQRQKATAERYNALVKYVGEFWGAVHDAIEGLKVTDEIEVGATHWVVSEKGADALTIHSAGRSHHYTLYELPPGLARNAGRAAGSTQKNRRTKSSSERFTRSIRNAIRAMPSGSGAKRRPAESTWKI